jgi:hypothetical protein
MSPLSPTSKLVASIAYNADRHVREQLCSSYIVSESDYVSNLTGEIRNAWSRSNLPSYLHSQTLDKPRESEFGCDALIVLKINNMIKLCLFEAKYPRLAVDPRYKWDDKQAINKYNPRKISHFSHQISRQHNWSHLAAIWEMFILEYAPGKQYKKFDLWGSTCVWHDVAIEYNHLCKPSDELWNNKNLEELVERAKSKPPQKRQTNLFSMLSSVISCRNGSALPIPSSSDSYLRIQSSDDRQTIYVPINLENMEELISPFCEESGVSHFWYFEIQDSVGLQLRM